MQVDPIKPTLKAPGSMLSKLRYDGPVSNFAFNFSLRRYMKGQFWSCSLAGGVLGTSRV